MDPFSQSVPQNWRSLRPDPVITETFPHKASPRRSPQTPPTKRLLGNPILLFTHRTLQTSTDYFLNILRTQKPKSFCISQSHRNTQKSPQSQLHCREKKNLQTLSSQPRLLWLRKCKKSAQNPADDLTMGQALETGRSSCARAHCRPDASR